LNCISLSDKDLPLASIPDALDCTKALVGWDNVDVVEAISVFPDLST
jgi:hypothetical protein